MSPMEFHYYFLCPTTKDRVEMVSGLLTEWAKNHDPHSIHGWIQIYPGIYSFFVHSHLQFTPEEVNLFKDTLVANQVSLYFDGDKPR